MIQTLFSKTKFSWIWLIIRVFVGVRWLTASFEKLSSPDWMQTGDILKTTWMHAVVIPAAPAKPDIYFDWFRVFIQSLLNNQSYLSISKLIAICEFLVGLALVLGFLVGFAAFIGGLMNVSLLLVGSIGYTPAFLVLELLLMIAWKTAGYYGLDRYFFKFIGAPWKPGRWFQKNVA